MKKIIPLFITLCFATTVFAADDNPPSFKDTPHGDWVLRLSADPKKDINYIFTGSKSKDGKVFLELGIFYADNAKDWVVVYHFNPSADKDKGVEIAFPSGIKGTLPIPNCNEQFCQAEVSKDSASFMNYLKNNPKGTLSFVDKENGNITIPFSLKGFNKAFEELQKTRTAGKKGGSSGGSGAKPAPKSSPEPAGPDASTQD